MIDPPWDGTCLSLKYPTMTDKEIKAMKVQNVISEGICFLWVTNSKIKAGIEALKVGALSR